MTYLNYKSLEKMIIINIVTINVDGKCNPVYVTSSHGKNYEW